MLELISDANIDHISSYLPSNSDVSDFSGIIPIFPRYFRKFLIEIAVIYTQDDTVSRNFQLGK